MGAQGAPPKPDPAPPCPRHQPAPCSRGRLSGSAQQQFPSFFEDRDKTQPKSQGEVAGLADTLCSIVQLERGQRGERGKKPPWGSLEAAQVGMRLKCQPQASEGGQGHAGQLLEAVWGRAGLFQPPPLGGLRLGGGQEPRAALCCGLLLVSAEREGAAAAGKRSWVLETASACANTQPRAEAAAGDDGVRDGRQPPRSDQPAHTGEGQRKSNENKARICQTTERGRGTSHPGLPRWAPRRRRRTKEGHAGRGMAVGVCQPLAQRRGLVPALGSDTPWDHRDENPQQGCGCLGCGDNPSSVQERLRCTNGDLVTARLEAEPRHALHTSDPRTALPMGTLTLRPPKSPHWCRGSWELRSPSRRHPHKAGAGVVFSLTSHQDCQAALHGAVGKKLL